MDSQKLRQSGEWHAGEVPQAKTCHSWKEKIQHLTFSMLHATRFSLPLCLSPSLSHGLPPLSGCSTPECKLEFIYSSFALAKLQSVIWQCQSTNSVRTQLIQAPIIHSGGNCWLPIMPLGEFRCVLYVFGCCLSYSNTCRGSFTHVSGGLLLPLFLDPFAPWLKLSTKMIVTLGVPNRHTENILHQYASFCYEFDSLLFSCQRRPTLPQIIKNT